MALDDHATQEKLTPEMRRELLRAFADRMLLKVTGMDDPEDIPGVEKAVRVAAVIERLYSRCDRAETRAPYPRKLEAERSAHEEAAIKAQVSLASTLEWGEKRRRNLGQWWDAAQNATKVVAQVALPVEAPVCPQKNATPDKAAEDTLNSPPSWHKVTYTDLTDDIEAARAELALRKRSATQSAQIPIPPLRGPPFNSG